MKFSKLAPRHPLALSLQQNKYPELTITEKVDFINLYQHLFYNEFDTFLDQRAFFEGVKVDKDTIVFRLQGTHRLSYEKGFALFFRLQDK